MTLCTMPRREVVHNVMAMPRTRSRTGSSLQAESDRRAFVVAGVHHELEAPSLELAAIPSAAR